MENVSIGTLVHDCALACDPASDYIPLTPASVVYAAPAARVRAMTLLEERLEPEIHGGAGVAVAQGGGAYTYGPAPEHAAALAATPGAWLKTLGYVVLIFALLGSSSMGPALDMIKGVQPTMKMFWRATGMLTFSLVGDAISTWRRRNEPKQRRVNRADLWAMFVMGVSYASWSLSYFVALKLTSVMSAYMFNQSHVVIVLVARVVTCKRLPWIQYLALVLIVAGVTISVDGLHSSSQLYGNCVAFAGSFAAIPFLAYAPRVQARLGLMRASVVMQASILVFVLAASVILADSPGVGIDFKHPFDPDSGALGWTLMRFDRFPMWCFALVIGSIVGMLGYTWVCSVLPAITVQAAMLLEPGVSDIMAVMAHTGVMPGETDYIGMGMLVTASAIVVLTDDTASHMHDDAIPDAHDDSTAPSESTLLSKAYLAGSPAKTASAA